MMRLMSTSVKQHAAHLPGSPVDSDATTYRGLIMMQISLSSSGSGMSCIWWNRRRVLMLSRNRCGSSRTVDVPSTLVVNTLSLAVDEWE